MATLPLKEPHNHDLKEAGRGIPSWLIVVPASVLVLAVYAWFTSVGTWTSWPMGTTYYDQLAQAFRGGHTWLDAKPDPKLLALEDPYDPAMRQDIPHLSDASLYKGRYYLYFGPLPAAVVLVAKTAGLGEVRDIHIAFFFTCGLFIVLGLFVVQARRHLFPEIPSWAAGILVAAIGLMSPFPWSLGNRAWVQAAAIAASAFFFMLGLLTSLGLSIGSRHPTWRAILAGLCWGCAISSRLVSLVPILFMVALVAVATRSPKGLSWEMRKAARVLLGMLVPLVLTLAFLALYNYVRFGNVLESGIQYALAFLNLHQPGAQLFSPSYVIQNLYNYLLVLPKLRYNFPYVWMQMGIRTAILPGPALPPLYFAEVMTGFLISTPFVMFGALAVILRRRVDRASAPELANASLWPWLEPALAGSFLCSFAVFLCYFWASERFLVDLMPTLLLLGVLGTWRLDARLRHQRLARSAAVVVAAALACASVVISILLALGLNADEFRLLDPTLWQRLNGLFRP